MNRLVRKAIKNYSSNDETRVLVNYILAKLGLSYNEFISKTPEEQEELLAGDLEKKKPAPKRQASRKNKE